MSERTRDGLEAARARGRTGGHEPKLGDRQARLAREMYEAGDLTVAQIAAEFGVSRPTRRLLPGGHPAHDQQSGTEQLGRTGPHHGHRRLPTTERPDRGRRGH